MSGNKKIEAIREKRNKTAFKMRMANPDHVREINKQSSKIQKEPRTHKGNLKAVFSETKSGESRTHKGNQHAFCSKRKAENPEHAWE